MGGSNRGMFFRNQYFQTAPTCPLDQHKAKHDNRGKKRTPHMPFRATVAIPVDSLNERDAQ